MENNKIAIHIHFIEALKDMIYTEKLHLSELKKRKEKAKLGHKLWFFRFPPDKGLITMIDECITSSTKFLSMYETKLTQYKNQPV